ncbi:hypothetical protein AB0K16_54000 [Nonomuraea jabiensis]|uniref:hypothetical protein n=1 Tax=Nonomuraea jabiensis TaxID=882448 RepID=UPI0034172D15
MIASYLGAERDLGRIAAGADVGTLAATLIRTGHLLFADRTGAPPEPVAVRKMVAAVIAGVERRAASKTDRIVSSCCYAGPHVQAPRSRPPQ